jgi:predicted RNA-binding Zn ribbon-like protein
MSWQPGHFIAGDVALDFANTVFRRTPVLGRDLLSDTAALAAWFQHAGVVTPAQESALRRDNSALAQARELRGLLWELFDARAAGRDVPGAALAAVLAVASRGLASGGTAVSAQGSPTVRSARDACAAIALHAVRLTLCPGRSPIRACDRCGWFFLDGSRGGRRRWCSMKTCGNQAKAARYRSAHR